MNKLIAKRDNDKLFVDSEEETISGKIRLGYVIMGNGKRIDVNVDDLLSRSSWDMVEEPNKSFQ
jgi:hypothetical protein